MTYSSRPTTEHPVVNATRARQGRWGRHMVWVLVAGTLLAVIGLFAAWTWKSSDLIAAQHAGKTTPATARAFDAPAPADVTEQKSDTPGAPKP